MKKQYVAVIQAGGKGTRMLELTEDRIPKPLLDINGKPMIEWQIESLKTSGISEFIIVLGHLGRYIEEYFGNGKKWDIKISYIYEEYPMGSAGALFFAKNIIGTRDIVLVFGDVMFEIDWSRFIEYHESKEGLITLLGHPNSHPYDSDLLLVDDDFLLCGIDSKNNKRVYYYKNFVNSGLSILCNEVLQYYDTEKKVDFEKDLVNTYIKERKVYAYNSPEYVKDAGTPKRYFEVCREQKDGLWTKKCLDNCQKAIFLDRDGTLNKHCGYVIKADEIELLPGVSEAVKKINESEFMAIVATNQPVIARGDCSVYELRNIHNKIETLLGEGGAYLNDIIYCPHHPQRGFEGEIKALKIRCSCRKPQIGMLVSAAERYNINLNESWYIGDTTVDIMTGINAGMKTILVKTGEAGSDNKYNVKADYEVDSLYEAVSVVLGKM